MPDVDMVLRSSGEQRLSNFLIWQAAYAEFVSLDTYCGRISTGAICGTPASSTPSVIAVSGELSRTRSHRRRPRPASFKIHYVTDTR